MHSKAIAEAFAALTHDMEPNGTVLVANDKTVLFERTFGMADRSLTLPTLQQTQYLIGSVSKQFAAVLLLYVLHTRDHDVVKALNKPLAVYLPENSPIWGRQCPSWAKKVTLHQVLNHTSGVPNYTALPDLEHRDTITTSELVASFASLPLEFEPGKVFAYSNSGYFLLGAIIEALTQQPLDRYLHDVFFIPLEMRATFLPMRGTLNDIKKNDSRAMNLARGYKYDAVSLHPVWIEENQYEPLQIPGLAGGLISTAHDLLKWNRALYAGKIISPSLLNLILTPYIQTEKADEYYGYGIEIKDSHAFGKCYLHRGGIPGFKSRLTYIPNENLTIVILENGYASLESLHDEIKIIHDGLSTDILPFHKNEKMNMIIEDRYPIIVANRKRFQLGPLEESILFS